MSDEIVLRMFRTRDTAKSTEFYECSTKYPGDAAVLRPIYLRQPADEELGSPKMIEITIRALEIGGESDEP